jgi:signal transduction histidine kinase
MRLTRIVRTASFRLTLAFAGLFGLSALALYGAIYWMASEALEDQVRTSIETEVTALVADYNVSGFDDTVDDIRERVASTRKKTFYYLLADARGRKAAGNLASHAPYAGWRELTLRDAGPAGYVYDDGDGDGDGDARDADIDDDAVRNGDADDDTLLLFTFGTSLDNGSFLIVGENSERIHALERRILRAFAWAFAPTLLIGTLGGVVVSSGFLHRIDAINETSLAIMNGRLQDRVPMRGTADELDRLAGNLNRMLDRIQALMDSLNQVSSDIAHDLRTPLARLRQRLEQVREGDESVANYRRAIDRAIADTDSILTTFSSLLQIASIEGGGPAAGFVPVDLSQVFASVGATYEAVAEERGQVLDVAVEPGIFVRGDRELLMRMLVNLVENALRHTPAGTRIDMKLERTEGGARGIVADSGPGIPQAARTRVFDRFYRLEKSRSTPGSGLGLAMVAVIAETHGIDIELADNAPGLRVALQFTAIDPA